MRHWLPGIALASAALAACNNPPAATDAALPLDAPGLDAPAPADGGPRDTGARADSPMMAMDDAATTDDAAMMAMDDAATMAMDDAAVAMTDAFVPFAPGDSGVDSAVDAFVAPAGNDTCATATVLTAGSYMGTTAGAMNDYAAGTGCTGTAGIDVVYAIDVPAGQRVAVTVDSTDTMFDPSINLVAGPAASCGGMPRTCLASDDAGGATDANTARWVNTTGAAATIYAVVDSFRAMSTGVFSIDVALDTPPAGDQCASATVLAAGTTMGTTAGATNDYGGGTGCVGTAGPDLTYAIDVPAGQQAVLTVASGDGTFDPSISLVAGPAATCGGSPRTCLASNNDGGASAVNSVRWLNTGAAATRIYAVVDSASTSVGPFTLNLTVGAPAAGDVCATAERITPGMVTASNVGFYNDFNAGTMCAGTAGLDRVYVISVPAGQTLNADVNSGDTMFDPSISLEVACGSTPRTCVDGDDSGGTTSLNSVTYTNTGAAAQDVFIVIDSFFATDTGSFVMNTAIVP